VRGKHPDHAWGAGSRANERALRSGARQPRKRIARPSMLRGRRCQAPIPRVPVCMRVPGTPPA
jgi:hypothetical protein